MFRFLPLPEFWKTILSSLIALLTLAGIMTRPFRWNEARIAMSGAGISPAPSVWKEKDGRNSRL